MSDEFQLYRVGTLYDPERTSFEEGGWLTMDSEGVRIVFATKDGSEADDVGKGRAEFAWVERRFSGYLLVKYGDTYWADLPYNPQRLPEPFSLPEIERGKHLSPVVTFLVHADTGILLAMRAFSWPAYFVNTIVASVRRIAARPYNEAAAVAEQDQLWAEYPTGPSLARLVRNEAAAMCLGGQRHDRPI